MEKITRKKMLAMAVCLGACTSSLAAVTGSGSGDVEDSTIINSGELIIIQKATNGAGNQNASLVISNSNGAVTINFDLEGSDVLNLSKMHITQTIERGAAVQNAGLIIHTANLAMRSDVSIEDSTVVNKGEIRTSQSASQSGAVQNAGLLTISH